MSSYAAPTSSAPFDEVLNAQNAAEAKMFAKDTALEVQKHMREGDWSLRLLALLGGLAMMAVAILGFVGDILTLNWFAALFEVYVFVLGVIIVVLESGQRFSMFARVESGLYKNALFLKYIWGRGIIYFVAGSIQISLRDLVNVVIGLYVCGIAILYIVVGRRAANKLKTLRMSACTPQQVQESFAKADEEGQGSLTLAQFQELVGFLGLDLNRRETEAAFMQIDRSQTGRLTYESIQMWWSDDAPGHDSFVPVVVI